MYSRYHPAFGVSTRKLLDDHNISEIGRMSEGESRPQVGKPVVVRTPDRREYRGTLIEIRGEATAVVRLDTGWAVSYPIGMVHADPTRG